MAGANEKPIPGPALIIPILIGEANFYHWKQAIESHIDFYGLQDFYDGTAKEPVDDKGKLEFNRRRIHSLHLLASSTEPVHHHLEAALSLDPDPDAENVPHALWKIIIDTIPRLKETDERGVAKTFYDLLDGTSMEGFTLHKINIRFYKAFHYLSINDIDLPLKAKVLLMIRAVGRRDPEFQHYLQQDFNLGHLTWEELQDQIRLKVVNEEE